MSSRKRPNDNKSDESSPEESDESELSDTEGAPGAGTGRSGTNTIVTSKPSRQDRRRESNRLSKRRCRQQRKEMVRSLESQIRRLAQEQKDLKAENEVLRKELLDNVLDLQKQPDEPAQASAVLPSCPVENRTSGTRISPSSAVLPQISVQPSSHLGLIMPSPRVDGAHDTRLASQALNVAGRASYEETEEVVTSITGAQNYQGAGPMGGPSGHFLEMISLMSQNQPRVQDSSFPLGLPPSQAIANQPAQDPLIAASRSVLPYLSSSNPRNDAGIAWMARFAASDTSGSLEALLNQHAASRPTLNFPFDLRAGQYSSISDYAPQDQQDDSDQKLPARK